MQQSHIGAAYVRVSTDDQTELSPDAQIRVIRQAAKADGYRIPQEYLFIERKGISGRRAENRPEFQRMIALAKSQEPAPFDRLYLWKFSRFARNQEESTFYKGILRRKCGVEIKSVSEPIMEGMFGRLIETIIEWFDEYYSVNLSGEVLRGMTEKALREGYQSSPCLGYRAAGQGRPYVIYEKEYRAVELIFRSYHGGKDMTFIARELNRLGYRTKRGNLFDRRAVGRILANRFYAGEVAWNGISFQGAHEIRRDVAEVFDQVQRRLETEYHPQGRRDASTGAHWLSGLLKCGVCHGSLGYNRSGSQQKRPDYFQCWKYAKGIHESSCSVSVHIAEEAAVQSLRQLAAMGPAEYEYVRTAPSASDEAETSIRKALSRLAAKERRIRDAYESGIDTLEEYRQNKQRLRSERSKLENAVQKLPAGDTDNREADLAEAEAGLSYNSVCALLADPDIGTEIKGNALRRAVREIVFDRKTNCFHFKYYLS